MSKQLIGKVVSTKMQKTIVVEVKTQHPHPIYKKVIRRSKRFKVHNENADIKVGNTVRIGETRPLSAHKRFRVLEVVS